MKMRKYIVALLMVAMLVTMSPLAVFADDGLMVKNDFIEDDTDGDWIQWNLGNEFTLYSGEKLYVDFDMKSGWSSWYTIPSLDVYPEWEDDAVYEFHPLNSSLVIPRGYTATFSGYHDIDSKHLEEGEYQLAIAAMPCDYTGRWPSDYYLAEINTEHVWFTIKQLPKPSKLTVKAGKKSAKLDWKKVAAADEYQIYRSTKKKSGYKKIATVSDCTYKNKGLKKGKTYYYKVKAVRGDEETGIAYSSYTSVKKVKAK